MAYLLVSLTRCEMKWCAALLVASLLVAACLDKRLHRKWCLDSASFASLLQAMLFSSVWHRQVKLWVTSAISKFPCSDAMCNGVQPSPSAVLHGTRLASASRTPFKSSLSTAPRRARVGEGSGDTILEGDDTGDALGDTTAPFFFDFITHSPGILDIQWCDEDDSSTLKTKGYLGRRQCEDGVSRKAS